MDAAGNPEPHEIKKWCAYHHQVEQDNEDTYLICFECNHVFQTADDLATLDMEMWRQSGPEGMKPRHPKDIFCCPLCSHDFAWHPEWKDNHD